MNAEELSARTKSTALKNGADLAGILTADALPEHGSSIRKMMPGAKSVLVIAAGHSLGALLSGANELGQFDTIHTYNESARAAHSASRFLESRGHLAAGVPAFIPLDMDEPGKGMRGEICWRRAGVRAGLGSYGESGALVTREFGQAVRLAGVITTAELVPDSPLDDDICDHCMKCVKACPVNALSGQGRIDKKKCGDHIFKFGFRYFQNLMEDMLSGPDDDLVRRIRGNGLRQLWQTFMTGNYYYCFKCQSQCPATRLPGD